MLKQQKIISVLLAIILVFCNLPITSSYAVTEKRVVAELSAPQLILTNVSQKDDTIELLWTKVAHNQFNISYEVYKNNIPITKTEGFSYTDVNLSPDTEYSYVIRGIGSNNEIVIESNVLNIRTPKVLNINREGYKAATGSSIASKIENDNNSALFSDRFIIKYKNKSDTAENSNRSNHSLNTEVKIVNIKYDNVHNLEIITLQDKVKIKTLEEYIQKSDLCEEVKYIQPDFRYHLLDLNDLKNSKEVPGEESSLKNYSLLEELPQYLKDLAGSNPELIDLINNGSIQEIRYKLLTGNVKGSYDNNLLRQLANELTFLDRNRKELSNLAESKTDAGRQVWWDLSESADNGKIYTSDIINAIQYAENKGEVVFYCNFGDVFYNPLLKEVISDSKMWFICASEEDSDTLEQPCYPADFDCGNIVSRNKAKSEFLRNTDVNYAGNTNVLQRVSGGEISSEAYADEFLPAVKGRFIQIDAFNYTNLALKKDGTVWAWGLNGWGRQAFAVPVQIEGLFSITAIACGMSHCLALREDGTVWAWGYNYEGELGDGTTISRAAPAQVIGLKDIIAIDAGEYHSLALKKDGTVWAWGENQNGQIGDGTKINRLIPVQVRNLRNIDSISAGGYHSLALARDSTVFGWGSNSGGEIGDGTNADRVEPVQVFGLGVASIAAGLGFSAARDFEGGVMAWGYNHQGQLGNGTRTGSNIPLKIKDFSGVIKLQCGYHHSLAIKEDGSVWTWGYNDSGQLGDGTTIDRYRPTMVLGMGKAIGVAGGESHSLALKKDGSVWEWGYTMTGKLGNGKPAVPQELAKYSFGTPNIVCSINSTAGSPVNLILKLNNAASLSNLTFIVTYNTNEIARVSDLCNYTRKEEKELGLIKGTGITIIENSPGIIKFTVNKTIPNGKFWSGIVNILQFESKIDGKVEFIYSIE